MYCAFLAAKINKMKTRRPNSVKYISNALAVIPVEKGKFLAVYQTI